MASCNNCGAFINVGDKRCPFCGEIIKIQEPVKPQVEAQPVKPQEPIKPQEPVKPEPIVRPVKPTIVQPVKPQKPEQTTSNSNNINNLFNELVYGDLFNFSDWKESWKNHKERKCGIILTDTRKLTDVKTFNAAVYQYIKYRKQNGISYTFLDLANEKVIGNVEPKIENIISLLRKIYQVRVPNYLMIIGDDNVIPKAIFANGVPGEDKFVPSDFCYISLDLSNPWGGTKYNLVHSTPVGRIPASVNNNFSEALIYFKNAIEFKPYSSFKGFALTANVWSKTSANVFAEVTKNILESPAYSIEPKLLELPLPSLDGYNLLGFNVHGSGQSNNWFGQLESHYPTAFSSKCLPNEANGYVLCTEACYGAKSKISIENKTSILLNALQKKCIGFVGSSMIAYGAANGGMGCADVIANVFMNSVIKGMELGDSFKTALVKLNKDQMRETEIKTLVEFALYGDPSLVFIENKMKNIAFERQEMKITEVEEDVARAIELIPISPLEGFVKNGNIKNVAYSPSQNQAIKNIANVIQNCSAKFVNCGHEAFSETQPLLFKLYGSNEYRSLYQKEVNGINEILYLHLDGEGNVKEAYSSK